MPEPDERRAGGPVGLLLLAHCGAVGVTGVVMAWGSGLPLLAVSYMVAGGLILLGDRGLAWVSLSLRPRRALRNGVRT